MDLYCILIIEAWLKSNIHFDCKYLELWNACDISLGFIVLNVKDGTKYKYPSIVFLSIFILYYFRREILALQSENYVLEKQLHSYQITLSKGNSNQKLQRDESGDRERRRSQPEPIRNDPERRLERRGERSYRYK